MIWNFLFSLNPTAIVVWIIVLVFIVYFCLGKYYFYEKIGEDGWKGLIPVYSSWVYFNKAKVNPWLSVIFISSFMIFSLLTLCCTDSDMLVGICTFFQTVSLIFYILISWKVNYFISRKFKKSYLTAFSLTILPILAFPIIGLSEDYKWSRFTRVKNDIFDEDFYNRKVTVGEMCLTNIFSIVCMIAGFYIFTYIFVIDLPRDYLVDIIWDPTFIRFFTIVFSIIILFGTLLDYFGNVLVKKYRRK